MMKHKVLKASGELVTFDEKKLNHSLIRAGADAKVALQILQAITELLYDGISTREIYRKAFDMLRSYRRPVAAKYKLKNAIMELGPSGFPFERYFSELLSQQGYTVQINQILDGACVTHEVDVIAIADNTIHYIECKFHNNRGMVTDIKVPLYIHARFNDLKSKQGKVALNGDKLFTGWVATNTKFSTDAIKYGNCAGLKLTGWDYPAGNSLREMIDATGLHPVTCLTTLTSHEKKLLLEQNMVLCKDLLHNSAILDNIGLKQNRLKAAIDEVTSLCGLNDTKAE